MDEWRESTLNRVGRIVTGKTPLTSQSEYYDGNIPFVTPSDFDGRRIIDATSRSLTETGAQSVSGSRIPAGSVMVSCIGSDMGKSAIAGHDCVTNQQINSLIVNPDNEPLFIYYNLSKRKAEIRAAAGGSAQPILNKSAFGQLRIVLPPINEQRVVVGTLGVLDDKIESNRRTSRALERLARAIFRAWFVDFEPVKAKTAGARFFPSIPQQIFDILPARLVESELGPVPEGWGVGSIGDVVEMRSERVDPSVETEQLPYVPIECISPRSLSLQNWKPGAEAKSSLQRFYRGDILFGAMRPYFHKVCLAPFDGTTRTTAFVLVPKKVMYYAYAALLIHDPSTVEYATQHSVGSTIPYAKWERSLADMPIVIPPVSHLKAFDEIVRPMLEPFMQIPFENARLSTMRDYLLPKLLNGEVRVEKHDA